MPFTQGVISNALERLCEKLTDTKNRSRPTSLQQLSFVFSLHACFVS